MNSFTRKAVLFCLPFGTKVVLKLIGTLILENYTVVSEQDTATSSLPDLITSPLITHNQTALPEVYGVVYATHTTTPPDIVSTTGLSRQAVHTNLNRLAKAGLIGHEDSTYCLVEPALPPTVVQSLAELGSDLRLDVCTVVVDRHSITVTQLQEVIDRSESNTRKILNALAEDDYLTKRESPYDEGRLIYRVTEDGTRALDSLADPTEYCGRAGTSVTHHSSGIEGTAFRTAYEIEDTYRIAKLETATVSEVLADTDKEEKATRRRLDQLVQRGFLSKTHRREKNVYRPTPRTQTMIEAIRTCEDKRRLTKWQHQIPEACLQRLPDPFFPTDLYEVLADLLHDPAAGLADEYIQAWKTVGFIDGNRGTGFQIVRPEQPSD